MANPTDSTVEQTLYLQELIEANKTGLALGDKVYYGDQEKIPFTPTVCVEAGDKRRELNGAPRRVMTPMISYILVYASKVGETGENRLTADRLSEQIETLIHANRTLDGRVIHSLVTAIEFGYLMRGNSLFRTSRLTVEGRQQVQLPS